MPDNTWTHGRRLLAIETSLGKERLLTTSLTGDEGISELFSFEVEMLSTDLSISAEKMIGDKVKVVISPEEGEGRIIHAMIRHTDRNGLSFRYGYQQANGQWRVVHAWGDGGLHDFQFAWLDAASQVRITDPQGQVWVVTLDSNGLPVSEIDPLAGVTSFEYDEVGRTVAVTNQNGHRTEYAYDDRGNLLQLTLPDGTAQHTAYDKQNKILQVADAKGST